MKRKKNILGFLLILFLVFCTSLTAVNQVVTSAINSGAGTLRQAIIDVGDGETITFNISGSDAVIISSELSITSKGMTINGYNNATGNNITIQVTTPGAGGTNSRVFHINASGKTFNFSNMTIKGGDTSSWGDDFRAYGGGIFFEAGTLYLDKVTISGSKAHHGGGLLNRNTSPTLTNCTISDNIAASYGGGIYNYGETGASSPTLTNCTISGNSAVTWGGGIYTSGISSGISRPILTNCTISGNYTTAGNGCGGGMYNYGHYCSPTLTNCTISGNSASGYTGGLYNDWSGLYIKNTILANNSGPSADFYTKNSGALNDNGYNIVESSYNYNWTATGDIYGEQANLNLRSTLADNGSSNGTKTLALYYGSVASVAYNAGSNVANNGVPIPATDQRGANRNGAVDIGAYEQWPGGDSALPVTLSSFTANYITSIAVLNWTTQSETNNQGWNVYRSNSNNHAQSIILNLDGIIAGAGTTSEETDYTYTDQNETEYNTTYWYWLESVSISGSSELFGPITLTTPDEDPEQNTPIVPENYGLYQNYPNPFNPSTEISFAMEEAGKCELAIYDVKGRKMITLFSGNIEAEQIYSFIWSGKDQTGKSVSSGVYLYKLISDENIETRRMMLVK